MSDAQYRAFMADRADMQDRRLVADSIRAEVADANPKHADFILDSPLAWYADGPVNDAMDEQWSDDGELGFRVEGLGEGLDEVGDADLEDWADAVYEADVGCM